MTGRSRNAVALGVRVLNILVLRGAGAGASVLLTLLVARLLPSEDSARFLLVLSVSTVGAVCVRWGLDDVIVRRIAGSEAGAVRSEAGRLLGTSHRRVLGWSLAGAVAIGLLLTVEAFMDLGLDWVDLVAALVISALVGLGATGGRAYQGAGRPNVAALVLNILVPGLTVAVVGVAAIAGTPLDAFGSILCYAGAALVTYLLTVWIVPVARPSRPADAAAAARSTADRRAANRLGGVVVAQQLLNWTALLLLPIAVAPAAYTAFVVDFRVANLVSLVMLALNFSLAARLAALHARGEHAEVHALTRLIVGIVLVASVAVGVVLVLLGGPIHDFAGVAGEDDWTLLVLTIGQVGFALSAVFALVLTMTHDEHFLLVAQGATTGAGVVLFVVLAFTTPVAVASTAFIATYAVLALVLALRVRRRRLGPGRDAADGGGPVARFEAAQAFKASGSAHIDGVNYARVIATHLYDDSLRGDLKKAAFALGFAPRLTASGGAGTLVFYSHRYKRRDDYDYIVDRLREAAGPDHAFVETAERVSPLQWCRTLGGLGAGLRAVRGLPGRRTTRLAAALLIAKYRSVARRAVARQVAGRAVVVTFCDAHPYDNLVAQAARAADALTVTAQHGQYRLLDAASMSSDAEAYVNFVSDRMLVWGAATVEELVRAGIDPERLRVTGWIRSWPSPRRASSSGAFGVMLNGANGAASNPALLATARALSDALGLDYVVRSHPNLDLPAYRAAAGARCLRVGPIAPDAYLERVDLSIAHASSAAVEMLLLGEPVYLLDDGALAPIFRRTGLSFADAEAIAAAIAADAADPAAARSRLAELRRWFNDDADQSERLRSALSVDER